MSKKFVVKPDIPLLLDTLQKVIAVLQVGEKVLEQRGALWNAGLGAGVDAAVVQMEQVFAALATVLPQDLTVVANSSIRRAARVTQFLNECVEATSNRDDQISLKDLHDAYQKWAKGPVEPMDTLFRDALERAGITVAKEERRYDLTTARALWVRLRETAVQAPEDLPKTAALASEDLPKTAVTPSAGPPLPVSDIAALKARLGLPNREKNS